MSSEEIVEYAKAYLTKVERIFFKQAVWDLKVVAHLIDQMADGPIKLLYTRELKHCVQLNPVRLRWVWFHSDIKTIMNHFKKASQ